MASTATRRIQKELADLQKCPLENIKVQANESDILDWTVDIKGPPSSPYKGGNFKLSIKFSADFPFKPPVLNFKTRIHHPNVDSEGNICIGLLKTEQWKPSTKMSYVLSSLYDLIGTPNPDDPLVAAIADTYKTDRKAFDAMAKEYTTKYAK